MSVLCRGGMGHFEFDRKFYVEGDVVPNHCWCQETRVFYYLTVKTAWSYLHLSGYSTSMWQSDRRTDRIAIGNTLLALCAVVRKKGFVEDRSEFPWQSNSVSQVSLYVELWQH